MDLWLNIPRVFDDDDDDDGDFDDSVDDVNTGLGTDELRAVNGSRLRRTPVPNMYAYL